MEFVTNIGKIELTDNQIRNWKPSSPWLRFSYVNGEVLGVSESEPSQQEIDLLKTELESLSDDTPEEDLVKQAEILIEQKKRELAIAALKAENKLDLNGNVTEIGKSSIKKE